MKKIQIFAVMALAVLVSSCSDVKKVASTDVENNMDSLCYAIGMSQSQGLKEYLVNQLHVDSACIDEFFEGFVAAAKAGKDPKKVAYFAGVQIGQQVSQGMIAGINREFYGEDSTQTINVDALLAGFIAGANNDTTIMKLETAGAYAQENYEIVKGKENLKTFAPNKEAGEKFIAEKAKEAGVKELGNGVYYKVITEGDGKVATATDTLMVNYEGRLIDGTVFDSNYDSEAIKFLASGVIPGFAAALTTMPAGSEWEVYIPQDQAYAEKNMGTIKPYSALIFKIKIAK